MKVEIHGTAPNGTEDSIVIEADTLEGIRQKSKAETSKRGWTNLYSKILED